ncbi:hypothetical protein SAMN05216252_14925 [Actinacidiphila glaucinigra]|uniref:Uncharacterized protein n=1 Tax=Actinacidiphila glaucinigra TaxID=235986 RepID=A0A239NUC5_9ACTN|nr:hypothetical protein SAMN05216252_14925 [Actinacidiphila glaucinigra]
MVRIAGQFGRVYLLQGPSTAGPSPDRSPSLGRPNETTAGCNGLAWIMDAPREVLSEGEVNNLLDGG